jgi:hypothetical protein
MILSELIVQTTLVLLVLAALVFAIQAFRQKKAADVFGTSFPTILLTVIVGWITTEVVSDTFGTSLGIVGEWAHLIVMFIFAGSVTLQLRRARKP